MPGAAKRVLSRAEGDNARGQKKAPPGQGGNALWSNSEKCAVKLKFTGRHVSSQGILSHRYREKRATQTGENGRGNTRSINKKKKKKQDESSHKKNKRGGQTDTSKSLNKMSRFHQCKSEQH